MMTTELTVLALAGLLQGGQFLIFEILGNMQVGLGYSTSPRDTQRHLTGMAGRSQRAMNNHFESLILFTIAVVVIHLGDKGSGLSAWLAWTYLGARILYVPAYLFGLSPWRSFIWCIGAVATMLMLLMAVI